jgi:nitroreductase
MDAMQAILTRRSVRRYTAEPVNEADVETLLRAAMNAPTSGNAQDWRFIVIRERSVLDRVPDFHPSAAMLSEASLAILVCGDDRAEKNPGRWPLNCAAAAENILLAAHARGLGAVWLAIWPDPGRVEGMTRLLGLPEGIHPVTLVPVGYPAEVPSPADRFDPSKIHYNRW